MSSASTMAKRIGSSSSSKANKENEVPRLKVRGDTAQMRSRMQDRSGEATPMPLSRPLLEETPELFRPSPCNPRTPLMTQGAKTKVAHASPLVTPCEARLSHGSREAAPFSRPEEGLMHFSLPEDTVALDAPVQPATPLAASEPAARHLAEEPQPAVEEHEEVPELAVGELDEGPQTAVRELDEEPGPAAVRGLDELAPIDFWGGEMPVKNTFINFATISPETRRTTKELLGLSCPRNFAPTFHELAPSPVDVIEPAPAPVVISLLDTLAPVRSEPATATGARRIQLNLNVWIKSSSSQAVGPAERPQRVSLAEHLAPHSTSQSAAGGEYGTTSGDTVCRRLFEHHSIG